MKKGSKRGRGRGTSGAVPAGEGRGRLSSTAAVPSSGATRRLDLLFAGYKKDSRVVREEVEAVVDPMTGSASGSRGLPSTTAHTSEPSSSPPLKSSRPSQQQVVDEPLMQFDDSSNRDAMACPPSTSPVADPGLPDDEELLLRNEEVSGGSPLGETAIDETQIDTHIDTPAYYCTVEAPREAGEEEELVEDDVRGDEGVLEPTCSAGQQSEVEVVVADVPRTQSPSRGRSVELHRPQSAGTTGHHSQGAVSQRLIPAWYFFKQCAQDKTKVTCTICHQTLKRGRGLHNLSTTCLTRHMNTKHELRWQQHLKSIATPGSSSRALAASATATGSPTRPPVPLQADIVPPPQPPPPAATPPPPSPSTSHGNFQLSLPQTLERKRTFGPSHPRAQALNASISKLLALEMLPYRLVETTSFKSLMEVAVPQYALPSRYYFARQAIPDLHRQVMEKVRGAMKNAVGCRVHLTTDTWTSKHGQGRYISVTAHWVNVVAAGNEAQILPPPRIAGHRSVPSASSTSASSSSPSTYSKHSTAATTGKRQQAVLKLLCLGDRPHTAQELWDGIQGQIDVWLRPLNLKPGKVVCDNGRNIVASLARGGLPHIPCMAHVLNLVVQKFLASYPQLSALLIKVRAVCSHFRRSHPAAARLSSLQRSNALPPHRLICDLPTRWNSTLHMLQRVCEQQKAIVEYQLQNARVSRSAEHFTTNDWATMRDVSTVLQSFQYATDMVSADNAIVSATVPIICLLQKTIQQLMEPQEEEEEEEEEEGFFSQAAGEHTRGSQVGRRNAGNTVSSPERVLCEEEEEEEGVVDDHDQSTPRESMERGWREEQEEAEEDRPYDDHSLIQGSLAHMSHYMLHCLRNDPRVARILTSPSYWVATLLDPRYKESITSLIPPLDQQRKMALYKSTLVDALLAEFPLQLEGSVLARGGRGGGGRGKRSRDTGSTTRKSMAEVWRETFYSATHKTPTDAMANSSRRQCLSRMVDDYMSTSVVALSDALSPFDFWVSKLDMWPELALYALEVLACPAASVLSERVFSTAGGVITDRRIRLSTSNVDILTFLKMNQAWIPRDLPMPPPE